MRNLIPTELSPVSMWMSLARRWERGKMVVSTRRMIGLISPVAVVSLSIEMVSSLPASSSRMTSSVKLRWHLPDALDCSVFLRISVILLEGRNFVTMRLPSSRLISSIIISWLGSAMAIARRPSAVSPAGRSYNRNIRCTGIFRTESWCNWKSLRSMDRSDTGGIFARPFQFISSSRPLGVSLRRSCRRSPLLLSFSRPC